MKRHGITLRIGKNWVKVRGTLSSTKNGFVVHNAIQSNPDGTTREFADPIKTTEAHIEEDFGGLVDFIDSTNLKDPRHQ